MFKPVWWLLVAKAIVVSLVVTTSDGFAEPKREGEVDAKPAQARERALLGHGLFVTSENVGLSGVGVTTDMLQRVVGGGRTSRLANGTDPESGLPRLYRLDIEGHVVVDGPCVIEQCHIRNTDPGAPGVFVVSNLKQHDCTLRDCVLEGLPHPAGGAVRGVVMYPTRMYRCIVTGGQDGVRIGTKGSFLMEECFVYGQIAHGDWHNDAVQMVGGVGDWDNWTIRRCRIEGPFRRQTSAIIIKADTDHISGLTVDSNLLSGGSYTLYTRDTLSNEKKKFTLSRIRILNNVFAMDSWLYGPYSAGNFKPDVWENNALAPMRDESGAHPISVFYSERREFFGEYRAPKKPRRR